MSCEVQVTFDAADPRTLSTFWVDVLGNAHPGPHGMELPDGADALTAWDEFLEGVGVPSNWHGFAPQAGGAPGHTDARYVRVVGRR